MHALEAVADAIMHHEGWFPGSRSNRNRNPGNLRSSPLACGSDADGYAQFASLSIGYDALIEDLDGKFTGHTRTGLGPDSTLLELFNVYAPKADHNNPAAYARDVAAWVSTALNRTITPETQLRELYTGIGEV